MRAASLLPVVALAAACAGGESEPEAQAPAEYPAAAMAEHLAVQLETLERKMNDIAAAMSDDRYAWRPMEGVRSVGQVFAHVAADNYFVPALLDMPVEGTGVTAEPGTVGAYEAARGTPEEIRRALAASFAPMHEALALTQDDLGREISLRGNPLTVGDLWVRAIVHLHEHLGQSIAYARANEVVPPWSR